MVINFPSSPFVGQIYTYNGRSWEWNGTYWESYTFPSSGLTGATSVGVGDSVISGIVNNILELKSFSGDGITITDDGDTLTFSASTSPGGSVTSVSGGTGLSGNSTTGAVVLVNTAPDQTVTLTGGTNIQIDGTYPNFGVNFTGTTGSNFTGGTVSGATNFTGGLTANTFSATTYQNLPVSAVTNGIGVSASTSNGTVTITNTAPDQTVTISGGTGITTGGTYPNFTLVNSAPDQTVTITGGTNIQIAGTYPNFGVNFTGSTSGAYLPLSGGTMTGGLVANSGVTANTISQTSYIDFTTGSTNPSSVGGRLFFDSTQKSLSYFDISNNQVPIAMGQQLYTRVWNATGTQIDKGKVIAITGTTNGLPSAILARNVHTITSQRPIGLAAENIPNGSEGLVLNNGILSGITLNTFVNGDTLYLSDTVPGDYVNTTSSLAFTARTNEIGYVLQTGTTTGKIYVNINNEDSNLSLTDIERNILEGNVISSGIYEYTGMTQGTGQTINVAYARGWIVRNTYGYATLPDVTNVYYTGGTNIPLTYLNSDDATYILINSGSTLYQQTTFPTPQQRRENIFLGKVVHPNRLTITSLNQTVDFDVSPMAAIRDLWTPLKIINQGVVVSANGVNMNINSSAGTLWGNGIGWVTNQQNPDSISMSGQSPVTFQYRTRLGPITGGTVATGNTTTINPAYYDLNGVITAVGGGSNESTNQRIYMFPTGLIRIQLGQTPYTNLAAAVAGAQTEQFVEYSNNRDNGILIGILSVNKNASVGNGGLANTSYAVFNFVSKFGEILGGTGGLSTTTLQQAYDNSSQPEIVINSTLDGLSIKNGTGSGDTVAQLIQGLNSGGTVTSFIRADGAFSGTSIFGTGLTATTVSATTYQNLPSTFQSVRISGTTQFSANTGTFINFSGVNISITSASTNTLVFSGSPQFTVPGSNNQVLTSDGSGAAVAESLLTFDGAATSPTLDVNGVTVGRGGSNISSNISIGDIAFPAGSTGTNNVSLGRNILGSNTSGNSNIGIGRTSLNNNTIGNDNVAIGLYSLNKNNSGCYNVAIGNLSLCRNGNGCSNIGVGLSSLRKLTSGAENIAVGVNSLGNGCGYAYFSNNIALGSNSQKFRTSGDNNISLGTNSQRYSTITSRNISMGTLSLNSNQGDDNISLGYQTLYNNTNGSKNIAIGSRALLANASVYNSGNGNIAIGYESLKNNVSTSDHNIAIGQGALYYNTGIYCGNKPDFNVAIGRCAMLNNNLGCENIAIGRRALMSNSGCYSNKGCGNVALGRGTMANNYTGCYNISLGRSSLYHNTTGFHNIALGRNSGGEITTGYRNISLGDNSLYYTTTGNYNISLGYRSLYYNTEGVRNIAIGINSLRKSILKSDNIAIGTNTLHNWVGGGGKDPNIAIGFNALYGSKCNTGAPYYYNCYASFSSSIAIGRNSQYYNYNGNNNVSLGNNTLYNNLDGSNNVAIGDNALRRANGGSYNIAIGASSIGYAGPVPVGNFNIAIGYYSFGRTSCSGNHNILLGYKSMFASYGGSHNIGMGYRVLYSNSGGSNIAFGYRAMQKNTAGYNNIALGYKAMYNNIAGYRNIAIGYCAESGNFSHSIILGGYAAATGNYQFVVGSSTIPVGTITTEACYSSKTWEIRINGNTYKVLLA